MIRRIAFALVALVLAGVAEAQTARPPGSASQTNAGGAATVQSHMRSLGYGDIHELRQGPDGQWIGKATKNGVERTVTVQPNGTPTAR